MQLDARRSQLLARRAYLLTVLHPPAPRAWATATTTTAPRPAEASSPSVQNLLLTLGGVLLTVAAIAFTLVSWGYMGIGGRSAVLAVVTSAALITPLALLRRGLASTAEAVAALGLVLLLLDAYALYAVALTDVSPLAYTAWAAALLAVLWTGYGLALPKLRGPLPAAVIAAQPPLLLWSANGATAGSAPAPSLMWALLGTAALDVFLAIWGTRTAVRVTAAAGAALTGGLAVLLGMFESLTAEGPVDAVEPAALLAVAAALALLGAWRVRVAARVGSVAAGLALIAGLGGLIAAAVPSDWAAPAYLLCAIAVFAVVLIPVVRSRAPRGVVWGLLAASGAVHVWALLSVLPLIALQLAGPLSVLPRIWAGPPVDARWALGGDGEYANTNWTVAVLTSIMLAAVLLVSARWAAERLRTAARTAGADEPLPKADTAHTSRAGGAWPLTRPDQSAVAGGAAVALIWAALTMAASAADGSYTFAVGWQLAITLVTLALALHPGRIARPLPAIRAVALLCGGAGAVSTTVLALSTRATTFTALGILFTAFTAATFASRAGLGVRSVTGCAAVVWGTALLGATAAAGDLALHQTAVVMVAVPAVVALLAWRLGSHPLALPLECTGALVGVLALPLAMGHLPALALVLALGGVIAAGTAIRAERRSTAGLIAVALFVLATWVRLAASEVQVPEAYALPVTLPALVVGALRCRRDPTTSSWTAYAPGLTATMVPSLFTVWGDGHWLRPLLLGGAALVVTLVGARLRLQALLVIGGAVLALVALHELAPYVVQAVDALPRWLPPALAGLLLLAVGATYEQRLREARRLRESLGRMR